MPASLALVALSAAPLTLAVAPFSSGDPALEDVGRGFSAALVTDLAPLTGLVLIEKSRLDLTLRELALWRTPLVDPATVAVVGRRLAADALLTGEVQGVRAGLRVTARVVDVRKGAVLVARSVEGTRDQIFALEKDVAELLVEALALQLSVAERAALRKARGKSFQEFLDFTRGLAALDQGDDAKARQHFEAAKGDPLFRAIAYSVERFKHPMSPLTDEEDRDFHTQLRALDPKGKTYGDALMYLGHAQISVMDPRQVSNKLEVLELIFERQASPLSGASAVEAQLWAGLLPCVEGDEALGPRVPALYEYLLRKYPTDALTAENAKRHAEHGGARSHPPGCAPNQPRLEKLVRAIEATGRGR